jgi:tetrahydromethanopterin S-methyltransferase subunit G
VAQALHRKANRPEIDAILAKKADLSDLQRIISAVENKIDITSFEQLVRAVEQKADKHETHANSFRHNEKSTSDIERSVQQLNSEVERRIQDLER